MVHLENGKEDDSAMIGSVEEFAAVLREMLEEKYDGKMNISVCEVVKNNGVKRTGLVMREEGLNLSPNIYLDSFFEKYRNGMAIQDICRAVIKFNKENKVQQDFDMSIFSRFCNAEDKICLKLVNADRNRDMLAQIPHREYLDMAIIYYIMYSQSRSGMATTIIDNKMMQMWGADEEDLYACAQMNTPRLLKGRVRSLGDKIMEMLGYSADDEDAAASFKSCKDIFGKELLYIASNTALQNGAAVILYDGILKKFSRKIGGDFYIIPSSVHECLFFPASMTGIGPDDIAQMVREVNQKGVLPEEVLSDHVYRYDAELDWVEIVG